MVGDNVTFGTIHYVFRVLWIVKTDLHKKPVRIENQMKYNLLLASGRSRHDAGLFFLSLYELIQVLTVTSIFGWRFFRTFSVRGPKIQNEPLFHVRAQDCQSWSAHFKNSSTLLANDRWLDLSFGLVSGLIHAVAQYKLGNELSDSWGHLWDVAIRKPFRFPSNEENLSLACVPHLLPFACAANISSTIGFESDGSVFKVTPEHAGCGWMTFVNWHGSNLSLIFNILLPADHKWLINELDTETHFHLNRLVFKISVSHLLILCHHLLFVVPQPWQAALFYLCSSCDPVQLFFFALHSFVHLSFPHRWTLFLLKSHFVS